MIGDLKSCFHACQAHEVSVNGRHRRIYERDAEWTGGYLGLAVTAEVEQDRRKKGEGNS